MTRLAAARSIVPVFGLLCALCASDSLRAQVGLSEISMDPFDNPTSQHATQVEPGSFSFGQTIVATFQSGRFFSGGASDIGFATSTDGGSTWTSGMLPGLTNIEGSGDFDAASDPSVAYDAKHGVWLIATLPLTYPSVRAPAVFVSISGDGGLTWQNPVTVAAATGSSDFDKSWIGCDNTAASPYFGNCYVEYDDHGLGNRLQMSTSSDGGATWTAASVPFISVLGGLPLALPSGRVVVPMNNGNQSSIIAVVSDDGGVSYGAPVTIATISNHRVAGGLRTSPLPSAQVDSTGRIYVAWQDCRFREGCASNDIVMSTSTDGTTWSPLQRVPIDALDSGADHFIPGIAVDPASPAGAVHLGITYYYYPDTQCAFSTCQLNVGFISTSDGGATWSVVAPLNATPMSLGDLANTGQGRMVGDYISTSFSNGLAFGVFAVANPESGGVFEEAMYSPASGLAAGAGVFVRSQAEAPVPGAASDHELPLVPVSAR